MHAYAGSGQVVQGEASSGDLRHLCQGVLLGGGYERGLGGGDHPSFVNGLCEAFDIIRDTEVLPGKKAYAQRDFVFTMRSLRRERDKLQRARVDVNSREVRAFS
jgi:hypothetical protein